MEQQIDLIELGFCEGEVCNRDGCTGAIETADVEGCSCHINPPCSACTSPRNYCTSCDWLEENEPVDTPPAMCNPYVAPKRRTIEDLDNTKVDWVSEPHTHFSMIKKGVYPDGMTQDDVRAKINGTFGGRFVSFSKGRFSFVAYTD